MRLIAAIPMVLSFVAFILSLLCLFAGSQKGFMEDYDIVTLNVSRIGQNLFNQTHDASSASNTSSIWSEIKSNISTDLSTGESALEAAISDSLTSLAHALNLHDFYSVHVLDFCEGDFTPAAVPNATLSAAHIARNVTACSTRSGSAHFVPSAYLARELANSSLAAYVNLTTLHWPAAIDRSFHAVETAASAVLVLYCMAIGLVVLALLAAGMDMLLGSSTSRARWPALLQIGISGIASFTLLLVSAIVTGIADQVAHAVNKYGADIGVSASRGTKLLVLTWVATGLMGLVMVVWGWVAWREIGQKKREGEKGGYA